MVGYFEAEGKTFVAVWCSNGDNLVTDGFLRAQPIGGLKHAQFLIQKLFQRQLILHLLSLLSQLSVVPFPLNLLTNISQFLCKGFKPSQKHLLLAFV